MRTDVGVKLWFEKSNDDNYKDQYLINTDYSTPGIGSYLGYVSSKSTIVLFVDRDASNDNAHCYWHIEQTYVEL
nr:hypothetical protein [Prevotella sp.]